ncbi:DUF1203 domain-containing protein [Aliikangiella coralliicola]|uniref:DUF1203 domain-containing protein n=1 Tax=Aliikangiella coralliicola TaxID=2592383 RepID=A0A545U611_9GAMM|nr:DUF1203 domain-containing protein [Aliikangiella coralliicola]TQV84915.1 DUF1203 domain-containing protein [Aliikangiella coralliicola]
MKFKIIPIRPDFLLKVRNAGIDDQNQPIEKMIAQGGEPCRDVLRRALPGEEIILASYCPFTRPGPYKEYGAVFVLAEQSSEVPDFNRLPLPSGSETDYLGDTFVVRAYSEDERIVDASLSMAGDAQKVIEQFFSNEEVHFILVRFAAYGCYAFRIERDTKLESKRVEQ